MATQWISPTWRMPENSNQSKVDNYSLEFDGANDEVAFASASSGPLNDIGTGDFTVSIWGNATTKADYGTLIGNWSTNGLIMWRVATSNVFECFIGGDSFTTTYTIPFDDTWHHYLIKRSGTNVTVYVDGVSVATGTSSATLASGAISYIGNQPHNSRRWSGKISQPTIYDSALTSAQITALYNSGTPVNPMALTPLPVAYYPLGGSSTGSASTLTTPNESVPSATVFDFDASDYIEVPQINTTGALSISAWVKTTDANYNMIYNEDEALRSGGNRNLFYSTVGAVLRLNLRFDSGGSVTVNTSGVTLNDGNWHNVSAVWNGTTDANEIKLFVDGILRGQGTAVEAVRKNFSMLGNIGGQNVTYDFDGQISNVQTYTTGLSYGSASSLGDVAGGEIATLYNNGTPYKGTQPQAANLKGWWKMNVDTSTWNGSDWSITDSSGEGNTGTSFGMNTANLVTSDLTRSIPYSSYSCLLYTSDAADE